MRSCRSPSTSRPWPIRSSGLATALTLFTGAQYLLDGRQRGDEHGPGSGLTSFRDCRRRAWPADALVARSLPVMRCEVVAIGTELLLGQIVDTNSAWIGEQLALAGIDSHFQTKVGDNLDRMVEALQVALDRNDAVICCGGLGPTQDDITRDAIARSWACRWSATRPSPTRSATCSRSRGRTMPDNNLLQADVPEGATDHRAAPGHRAGPDLPGRRRR